MESKDVIRPSSGIDGSSSVDEEFKEPGTKEIDLDNIDDRYERRR